MNNQLENYKKLVSDVNDVYRELQSLTNDELRAELKRIGLLVAQSDNQIDTLNNHLVMVFAIVKETARRFSCGNVAVIANDFDRFLAENYDFVFIDGEQAVYKKKWDAGGVPFEWNMIHYDEQILGGIMLHYGYAIEMATGEGKTLVATLPVLLNALTHKGVHVMTVNSYLSKRDCEITRPIYMFHGLKADCIEYFARHDNRRKKAYQIDITFGTNSTFTFDYLYDHLATSPDECVQQNHNYAIIDELDSILIDNADEPHIIGGGNYINNGKIYKDHISIVKELIAEDKSQSLYISNQIERTAQFTKQGEKWLADKLGVEDLYSIKRTYEIDGFETMAQNERDNVVKKLYLQNVLHQLLRALIIMERDVDYTVVDDKVKIIDSHTGRVKETSRWEHGLHTAVEVKEGVSVQNDYDGMAVISLKNYFKLYDKISGMSGTIMPVERELHEIYNLKSVALPTHRPTIRVDEPLRIYRTKEQKDNAIVELIIDNIRKGRPSLVGNTTLKRSDYIGCLLEEKDVPFNKLDARTTKEEAITVAKAGIGNTVTVSTSVAGRGTDIKPSDDALANGGLYVIGTDMFDSIRIDRQLKGRSGRQGNPGTSVFFVSLEDTILKNLNEEDRQQLFKLSEEIKSDDQLSSQLFPFFEKAQINRESFFRKCREEVARKDDIVAPRRRMFYIQRNKILFEAREAESLIDEILLSENVPPKKINAHLEDLYDKTRELMVKSSKVTYNQAIIPIPFSDNLHTFAINLNVDKTKNSYEYFCNEFKRQITLQIYDKCWKRFVIYMMGNLDKHEIEQLDEKYKMMMSEINKIILSRLRYSTIPVGNDGPPPPPPPDDNREKKHDGRKITISPDDPCPCGSNKKYCECHGSNIRSNKKRRR